MLMPLFTVTIVFEDRTFAIEQVDSDTAEHALTAACEQAEAFAEHDAQAVAQMLQHRTRFVQIAQHRGVWSWHQVPHESGATSDVFGGIIVQTDSHAPSRE